MGRATDGAGDVGDTLAGECRSQPLAVVELREAVQHRQRDRQTGTSGRRGQRVMVHPDEAARRSSPTARFPSTATFPTGSSIGGAVVAVGGGSGMTVVGGVYARWFAEHGVIAAVQRPDFVVFGTAEARSDVDGLLRALQERLTG